VFHTKYAYWFSNAVGVVKICTLLFVILTGFVVLGGNTKVENPKANFQDAWSGSSKASAYGFTTALYRIIFSYGGYNNAFNVANEVKVWRLDIHVEWAETNISVDRTPSDRSKSMPPLLLQQFMCYICSQISHSLLPVSYR
jgi:hypothetical protein